MHHNGQNKSIESNLEPAADTKQNRKWWKDQNFTHTYLTSPLNYENSDERLATIQIGQKNLW